MYYSYFIKYEIWGLGYRDVREIIIYTNKRILTNQDIRKVEEEMFKQYRKYTKGTGYTISNINLLGQISKEEAMADIDMIFTPFKL